MPAAPGYPPQPYYPATYPPAHGSRYPTAPYYYSPSQHGNPYYPQPPAPHGTPAPTAAPPAAPAPAPAPAPASVPPPTGADATVASSSTTTTTTAPARAAASSETAPSAPSNGPLPPSQVSGLTTFSAATGNAAPGGTQGAWSEEEIDRLKKLAEQSKDMGGNQNRGEIEWDWVVQQWGTSRTR